MPKQASLFNEVVNTYKTATGKQDIASKLALPFVFRIRLAFNDAHGLRLAEGSAINIRITDLD